MGRAPAVLTGRRRVGAGAALLAALVAWYLLYDELPDLPTGANVVLVGGVLLPAIFALVWLALPLREARGLLLVALALGALTVALDVAGADISANFAKLAAVSLAGFWFLGLFERPLHVVVIAAIIPVVDAISVWRGPTHHIVTERPKVFDALSISVPVPHELFGLGLPDVLFFALFVGAAARWDLRVAATWLLMILSFGATIVLTVWVDPFGIGGLPALPGLSIAFLAANADLLWRRLRQRDDDG